MTPGRDSWFDELDVSDDPAACPCQPMDSEDLLFLMYTSGTTAKPKGIAHTTGGYLVGDGARQDDDGYYWLMGRIDDVMNVSGHRISTIEVESALVDHKSVAEAAVVSEIAERAAETPAEE